MKGIVAGSRLYVFAIRRFDEHSWVTMLLSLLLCDEGAHSAAGHDDDSHQRIPFFYTFFGCSSTIYAVNQM